MEEQVISLLARPVESMPSTRYVNGETRYMKIQNPGRAVGLARTLEFLLVMDLNVAEASETYPQKINVKEKSSWAMFPAVSAVSMPAIIMSVKVEVKIKNTQTKRNISAPRS